MSVCHYSRKDALTPELTKRCSDTGIDASKQIGVFGRKNFWTKRCAVGSQLPISKEPTFLSASDHTAALKPIGDRRRRRGGVASGEETSRKNCGRVTRCRGSPGVRASFSRRAGSSCHTRRGRTGAPGGGRSGAASAEPSGQDQLPGVVVLARGQVHVSSHDADILQDRHYDERPKKGPFADGPGSSHRAAITAAIPASSTR